MSVWRCDSVEMLWLTLVWSVNTVTLRWWLCGCYSVEMLCFILVWLVVCVCVFDCDSTLLAVDCCCALLSIWPLFSNLQGGSFCCHQTDETIIRERGWGGDHVPCRLGKKDNGDATATGLSTLHYLWIALSNFASLYIYTELDHLGLI